MKERILSWLPCPVPHGWAQDHDNRDQRKMTFETTLLTRLLLFAICSCKAYHQLPKGSCPMYITNYTYIFNQSGPKHGGHTPFFFKFIYLFWKRERARAGEGQTEREGERISSRFHTVSTEPNMGLELTNHELMTWAEIKNQMSNEVSNPGAPRSLSS